MGRRRAVNPPIRPTDLALKHIPGITDTSPTAEHLPEMPFGTLVRNHPGTMHAPAQFALANASVRAIAAVLIELKDLAVNLTFAGSLDWFISAPEHASV